MLDLNVLCACMDLQGGSACCACKLRTKSLRNDGMGIGKTPENRGGSGFLKFICNRPFGDFFLPFCYFNLWGF